MAYILVKSNLDSIIKQLHKELYLLDTQNLNLDFIARGYSLEKDELMEADIQENIFFPKFPNIFDILLIDRTTSTSKRNQYILWANDNYSYLGDQYQATSQIRPFLITGHVGHIIKPRALKTDDIQKNRTKSKAEVFTPTWVVKKQNDIIDQSYSGDNLEAYIKRKWLEITCGEAPYMVSRYEMETGKIIPLTQRVGFVDRKLSRINADINDKAEWQLMVEKAYQSSYGFEWNGDSLFLARENLLFTYRDYYLAKWKQDPLPCLLEKIANIISYNIFQMDGLKYIIPLSDRQEIKLNIQLSFFDDLPQEDELMLKKGKRVRIMNWETNKMEYFDKGL